jgi:hypothetical protein
VDVGATVDVVVDVWVDSPIRAVVSVVVVDVPDTFSSDGFSAPRSSSALSPFLTT